MELTNVLASVGAAVQETRKLACVEEVIGEDGMSYCKECGEPLLLGLDITGPMAERLGKKRYVPRNCACMRLMFAEQDLREQQKKQEENKARMRRENLKTERYRDSTFSKDDGGCENLRKFCEKYVANYKDVMECNLGLAFVGSNGTGKTFWASCIANALIDEGATVYMSTLTSLIREMNANYGENRPDLERKIKNVDFLILDDYGAERGTEYSLEQAFEILDTRYSVGKPLIITANLTEETLKNPTALNYARSYSRVLEMCPVIVRVEGERRSKIAEEKRKEFAKLLKGE